MELDSANPPPPLGVCWNGGVREDGLHKIRVKQKLRINPLMTWPCHISSSCFLVCMNESEFVVIDEGRKHQRLKI